MKKITLVLVIFSLILSTAIIKNSSKKNEDIIFTIKGENKNTWHLRNSYGVGITLKNG